MKADGRGMETATEAFRRNERVINGLLFTLRKSVGRRAPEGRINWAAVGDLAEVADLLERAAEIVGAGPEAR
ncbi:MAG: hypothetical protein ACRD1P_07310 [Thermoanaerobaculia bacterium]